MPDLAKAPPEYVEYPRGPKSLLTGDQDLTLERLLTLKSIRICLIILVASMFPVLGSFWNQGRSVGFSPLLALWAAVMAGTIAVAYRRTSYFEKKYRVWSLVAGAAPLLFVAICMYVPADHVTTYFLGFSLAQFLLLPVERVLRREIEKLRFQTKSTLKMDRIIDEMIKERRARPLTYAPPIPEDLIPAETTNA